MSEKEITISWETHFTVRWDTSQITKCCSNSNTTLQVVDLLFTTNHVPQSSATQKHPVDSSVWYLDNGKEPKLASAEVFGSQEAFRFLISSLEATKSSGNRVVRLIIPLNKGVIVRSDIIPLRLGDAMGIEHVASFAKPLQSFPGDALHLDAVTFPELFRSSAGGILLQHSPPTAGLTSGKLAVTPEFEAEFEKKLSIPLVVPAPAARKRIVLVGCSYRDPSSGAWTTFACSAARALGIDLVIIERPGCWIERSEYSDWYEALLPAGSWWSNPPSDDMADHIVAAVRSYGKKVDGIVAFLEPFLATVSRAAQKLGLPCQPAESYEIATDKYKLAMFEGREPFYGSTAEDALNFVSSEKLNFPLILKPRLGLNSEGVVRVDDAAGVQPAVEMIQKTFFKSFTMERYCDGPEVDVNVVLLDGEVVFCEISDDFPKSGDKSDAGIPASQRNFLETYIVHPSALPPTELEMLQKAISMTIRRLGFSSGIMHVEARVDQSSVEYRPIGTIMDLCPTEKVAKSSLPSPWVLEINPRPPGLTASRIVESVYGIDYFGVALTLAINDKERVRALARPFLNGAQHTGAMVLIGAEFDKECEGIFDSDDICEELLSRRPDLAQNINRYECLAKRGQRIPHPSSGANTFVAYFNVFSKSRKEALEIAADVRKELCEFMVSHSLSPCNFMLTHFLISKALG
ncbi:glutathione synthetase ATP-binding domain-like protein [Annulohypoxylon maeteangense]|uniref:glutathione synthetase ATP-binding domain-like protein n=1 Tax=Annulohypoxylon maeteangense TaxID=1927788 RepID=UPI002007385B|nr:glutathione synthetase ATP-binding domain-like protein [Annulohypoxylon maeteangense]KAI0885660.1 glutathione synthetase ATP-binding domain-like protein [Annulohypoxylon maeteangense]